MKLWSVLGSLCYYWVTCVIVCWFTCVDSIEVCECWKMLGTLWNVYVTKLYRFHFLFQMPNRCPRMRSTRKAASEGTWCTRFTGLSRQLSCQWKECVVIFHRLPFSTLKRWFVFSVQFDALTREWIRWECNYRSSDSQVIWWRNLEDWEEKF